MTKLALHWEIAIAIALAIILGLILSPDSSLLGITFSDACDFVGTLFLNGLKMVIVPLVVSSIICGVSNLGTGGGLGRLGGKTLGFYMCSSILAILVGLVVVNVLAPGIVDGEPAGQRLNLSSPDEVSDELKKVEGRGTGDVAAVFLRMVPQNIIAAAAEGQMLGLICFAILFGYFMLKIAAKNRDTLVNFWQGVFDVMMHITLFIMKFAPIGVFGLVAKTVVVTGFAAFQPLLVFFIAVLLALGIHMFVTMSLILKYVAKVNPLNHYRAMAPALLTAFSTASSSGTLPVTMECVEKNAGVSKKTTAFVLPLGATVNMDGTALYECVAAMFIAQAYGLDLTLGTQFLIVVMALLTSIGVAGIPSASLVAITIVLAAVGLPAEGIGMLLVTDRILDMLRTGVNVFSDSCCAVVIAKTEGEEDVLTDKALI